MKTFKCGKPLKFIKIILMIYIQLQTQELLSDL
ncbi:hypothetical protein T03_11230 [Trichinella britovi]|uniref:Uncharacterized protein n=1 Tax=Trichinella britovi TaxID=45882 RepID=A0A0V0YTW6_TRIBR|nr:hypothetical protein T03_11230 [Trichinella britovi]